MRWLQGTDSGSGVKSKSHSLVNPLNIVSIHPISSSFIQLLHKIMPCLLNCEEGWPRLRVLEDLTWLVPSCHDLNLELTRETPLLLKFRRLPTSSLLPADALPLQVPDKNLEQHLCRMIHESEKENSDDIYPSLCVMVLIGWLWIRNSIVRWKNYTRIQKIRESWQYRVSSSQKVMIPPRNQPLLQEFRPPYCSSPDIRAWAIVHHLAAIFSRE